MILAIAIGVVTGAVIGGVIGYFGLCATGTCPLTGNPYSAAIFGAVMGGMIASAIRG